MAFMRSSVRPRSAPLDNENPVQLAGFSFVQPSGFRISLPRFEAGLGIAWALGYPVTQTVVVSALSKVLTREQQGLWMGNLAAAGSAGRIAAPLLSGFLYTKLKSHTGFIPVLLCLATTLLACILVATFWARLGKEEGENEEEDEVDGDEGGAP